MSSKLYKIFKKNKNIIIGAIHFPPLLIGSGANKDNVKNLLQYANGIIVSTSLKKGRVKPKEVNVKTWQQRIEIKKVKEFLAKIK